METILYQKLNFRFYKQIHMYLSSIEENYKEKKFNLLINFGEKSIEYKNYKISELLFLLNKKNKAIQFAVLKEIKQLNLLF